MTRSITVAARAWAGGRVLILNEDHATQMRDYLDTVEPNVDHIAIRVSPLVA